VFIWKKKGGKVMRMMCGDRNVVTCVEPHPRFPFLATSGIGRIIRIWSPESKKVIPLPKHANQVSI
jgi:WD repeat-containing protein 42A